MISVAKYCKDTVRYMVMFTQNAIAPKAKKKKKKKKKKIDPRKVKPENWKLARRKIH